MAVYRPSWNAEVKGQVMGSGQASATWLRCSVEHAWHVIHGTVRYRATLTHWLEGTDLNGEWQWQLHPSPDTFGLFTGALGTCTTKRAAMAELEAEVARVAELVEKVHGEDGPPIQVES